MNYPSREKLIELLIEDSLNSWYDRDDKDEYFAHIMRRGFVGYDNLTDQQLIDECIDREFFEEIENA